MKTHLSLAIFVAAAALISPLRADEEGDDEAMAVAHHYGMDDFDRMEALKFTCNVRQGATTVSRAWNWDVVAHQVTLDMKRAGKPVRYVYDREAIDRGDARRNAEVDRWFEEDTDWLLFPLRFTDDRAIEVSFDEDQPLPIPPGSADLITVDYGSDDRMAGDTDEIYVDDNRTIRQRAYRKDGAAVPTLIATWDDQERLGPIVVALHHRTSDGRTEVWFTNVEARVRGSDAWVRPHAEK